MYAYNNEIDLCAVFPALPKPKSDLLDSVLVTGSQRRLN